MASINLAILFLLSFAGGALYSYRWLSGKVNRDELGMELALALIGGVVGFRALRTTAEYLQSPQWEIVFAYGQPILFAGAGAMTLYSISQRLLKLPQVSTALLAAFAFIGIIAASSLMGTGLTPGKDSGWGREWVPRESEPTNTMFFYLLLTALIGSGLLLLACPPAEGRAKTMQAAAVFLFFATSFVSAGLSSLELEIAPLVVNSLYFLGGVLAWLGSKKS